MSLFDNKQEIGDNNQFNEHLSNILVFIHLFIIIFAIMGNSLVIYMVLSSLKLRNVRNSFMINLTFSNLLLASICAPWFLVTLKYPNLAIGNLWCKISHTIPIVVILVSSFSIMMISIDRCMFVVFSRSRQFKCRDVAIIILVIWLFAILLAMPVFYHRYTYDNIDAYLFAIKQLNLIENLNTDVLSDFSNSSDFNTSSNYSSSFNNLIFNNFEMNINNDFKKIYCVENWDSQTYRRIYVLILFSLEFVLPCMSMLVTYIWIIRFLKVQHIRMSHHELLRKKLIQKEKPHQKNCKLLTALCLTFTICCLPLSLFNIITDYIISTLHEQKQDFVYSTLKILTTLELLNAALSPFLYGLMNYNFRLEIKEKIKDLKRKYRYVDTNEMQFDDIKLQYPVKFNKLSLI